MEELVMDAVLANIFLNVQNRLSELPELKFIDQDLGQLEIDEVGERESPVAFPCSLFDIAEIRYTDNSFNSQQGEGILEVRLALLAYSAATHYYKDNKHKQNALAYYNIEHRVNKLLQGWSNSEYFNPLSRMSAQTERRKDNIRVRVLRYSFGFVENTAMAVPAQTIERPDLEIDMTPPIFPADRDV
jgi:hypothetical protein